VLFLKIVTGLNSRGSEQSEPARKVTLCRYLITRFRIPSTSLIGLWVFSSYYVLKAGILSKMSSSSSYHHHRFYSSYRVLISFWSFLCSLRFTAVTHQLLIPSILTSLHPYILTSLIADLADLTWLAVCMLTLVLQFAYPSVR